MKKLLLLSTAIVWFGVLNTFKDRYSLACQDIARQGETLNA